MISSDMFVLIKYKLKVKLKLNFYVFLETVHYVKEFVCNTKHVACSELQPSFQTFLFTCQIFSKIGLHGKIFVTR